MKTDSLTQGSFTGFARRARTLTLVAAVATALAACGGGGGGGSATAGASQQSSGTSGNSTGTDGTTTGNGGSTGGSNAAPTGPQPLPVGSGITTFSFGTEGEFVHVNASTGAVTKLSNPCTTTNQGFSAADTRPDGMVVAAASDLYLIDMLSGDCQKLVTPTVPMGLVAVAADGKIYTVGLNTNINGNFDLYVLDATGNQLSKAELNGADLGFVKGIDFAPDGTLYLSAHDNTIGYQVFKVNTSSGLLTAAFGTSNLSGDIDIDSSGNLRSNGINQTIYTINIANGALIGALPTDRVTERVMVYR